MTLSHETVGHFGIRAILGENYSRAMGEIYAGNADIRNEVDARMESNPKLDRDIAVEELLAERAEREVNKADAGKKFSITGALKQFINYLRRFARSIGVPLRDVTDLEIAELIANARNTAASTVNTLQVLTNFEIGRRIVEHEQKGEKRAEYGKELLEILGNLVEFSEKERRINNYHIWWYCTKILNNIPVEIEMVVEVD